MLFFQYNTIKFYEVGPIKNRRSPLLAQNEVRDDIFSGSLAVFQSERVASVDGRRMWDSKLNSFSTPIG